MTTLNYSKYKIVCNVNDLGPPHSYCVLCIICEHGHFRAELTYPQIKSLGDIIDSVLGGYTNRPVAESGETVVNTGNLFSASWSFIGQEVAISYGSGMSFYDRTNRESYLLVMRPEQWPLVLEAIRNPTFY